MGKKKPEPGQEPETVLEEETAAAQETTAETPGGETPETPREDDGSKAALAAAEDKYLRLLAEYDNFRKRSLKEKDELYTRARAETVEQFLPVYDNLERALAVPTTDEAYKKGVEMTMTGLCDVLGKLGVEIFGEAGEPFDPNMHNAVMHDEDAELGENVLAEVFQKGFRVGEKVVRFAMVRVAN